MWRRRWSPSANLRRSSTTFWRILTNLPRFMHHLNSVNMTGANTSHWVAKAPAGQGVAWDAEIINE